MRTGATSSGALLVMLVACDAGRAPQPPAVEPPPVPAPPTATLRGRVTVTLHGPGANSGRAPFARVTGRPCTVEITGDGGIQREVATDDAGELELHVPAGRYTVSFAACAQPCCSREPTTLTVDATPDRPEQIDWTCECHAK